ncbi:MAG TPA: hypothetical protein VN026_10210 [Bacteroidia bacterium]|jgi:hypothetical protein|nr:hypothetical protein [Bacteroidia bacterium]
MTVLKIITYDTENGESKELQKQLDKTLDPLQKADSFITLIDAIVKSDSIGYVFTSSGITFNGNDRVVVMPQNGKYKKKFLDWVMSLGTPGEIEIVVKE